ncbi:MAG: polysaccharide deacetylase family protein [candidate division Zixibacteria bacterium]|nr:polysaccharide deacetylase family protein [candidate division Zixibacteria bacterium]
MNIALILSQLEVTGAEAYAVSLADYLIRRGHTVTIVSDTLTLKTSAQYLKMDLNHRSFPNRLKHIYLLSRLIKEKDVDILHAFSRASGWVSFFASRICGIPLITTVHGRQHLHLSRKILKGFGNYIIAVCENIKDHLVEDLGVKEKKIEVIRNGFDFEEFKKCAEIKPEENLVSLIGRLSGPKGEVAYQIIKEVLSNVPGIKVNVIGGSPAPERFKKLSRTNPEINFLGFKEDILHQISKSQVVIGSGRIAISSLALGVPTIAVGESCSIGLVTRENISEALKSNFGDIAKTPSFDYGKIRADLIYALKEKPDDSGLKAIIQEQFDIEKVGKRIESIYRKLIAYKKKKEIPILAYHRVVESSSEAGRHGIYVTRENFDWQMEYLKKKWFVTLTFRDYANLTEEQKKYGKYIFLTFDDGYEDNYRVAFPILRKYGFKATVFLVADKQTNEWDRAESSEPEVRLLSKGEILEMKKHGIEFGSHTLTHSDLTKIPLEAAKKEIFESKKKIEEIIQDEVITFAYPYGKLNQNLKEFVKQAGYKFGIATDSGSAALDVDWYEIRRILLFPKTGKRSFRRKVSGRYNFWKRKEKKINQIKENT